MEAPYAQPLQPSSTLPSYAMPPGVPSTVPAGDASYRRDPPPSGPPSFHGPPHPQHPNHPTQFNYPSSALPSAPNRTPLPDQLVVVENGVAPPPDLPSTPEQVEQDGPRPPPHSMVELGRRYALDVVQQPKRARMCGFGDKDRRPITPPPCIRLVVTDAMTGVEIDVNDIDYGLYVLNVDLWSADGRHEVNLVRHSAQSPAISSTVPSSYGQSQVNVYHPLSGPHGENAIRDPQYAYQVNSSASNTTPNPNPAAYNNPFSQTTPHYGPPSQPQNTPSHASGHYPSQYQPQGATYPPRPTTPGSYPPPRQPDQPPPHMYYHTVTPQAVQPRPFPPNPHDPSSVITPIPSATGMYTRNLIGSLSASAFRLVDPNDKCGVWFVLQDLSVRTEGRFRLRFSFVNVGAPNKSPKGSISNTSSVVNTGRAPILASCYSDVFAVFSAKKFPGVVESTALSKCFAMQGIKIPIRKDGPGKANQRGEYDDDE